MKKNILLIDDESVFNFLTSQILKKIGLANEIKIALNGVKALTLLEDCKKGLCNLPDLIFLDINMPLMNGFEFLAAFQRLELPFKQEIIIAIVSSSDDEGDRRRAKYFGIKYFFSKPLMEEDIYNLIDKEHFHESAS